ncbi:MULTISPECIES: FTR1 family protein [unclassified Corynebacterium]|uniref:FTR1 family iron permease n=1 Tax=unclassified Corynebacterium TaxID=2624378 RepID=UPI002654F365|nr:MULTISPECIES: FTR1 family protein [unclassified Corynebacterium]MDN8594612.1 FTR1 family protein [Corynebacterium sp. P4_F2]WKK55545.1 FTR1 family protein [Corynebacterium sp. P4-C1]WKK62955.1 FTR1 family protein [Corynebacterium sp. P8-C1]
MFIAAFLVGLREGLEASLIVGMLFAAIARRGNDGGAAKAGRTVWVGVVSAAVICTALGALFTFGRYGLSFRAQEAIGGIMSLIAVAMITGMIVSLSNENGKLRTMLDDKTGAALAKGTQALFWLAFVAVAREGIELTLLLWGWTTTPSAVGGAFLGIGIAVVMGWLIYRGALKLDLGTFFTWSSALLIVVAAGILAYAVHDLQEAQFLPGPFSGAPIAPTHPRTGEVLTGFDSYPFWMASFPFGWAFNLEDVVDPAGITATLLQAFTGFMPQMSWLQVIAWFIYIAVIVPIFIKHVRAAKQGRVDKRESATDAVSAHEENARKVSL